MVLEIDDTVIVTGKSAFRGYHCLNEKFVINQIWKRDGVILYAGEGVNTWYPEGSLRLVEPKLKIGNQVEVVHAQEYGSRGLVGERFVITAINDGLCTAPGFPWIPEDHLKLVEELKVGDHVAVIDRNNDTFQIDETTFALGEVLFSAKGKRWFKASELQKITPLKPTYVLHFNLDISEALASIRKARRSPLSPGTRRVCELLEGSGLMDSSQIAIRLGILEACILDNLIEARKAGVVKLVDGEYSLA